MQQVPRHFASSHYALDECCNRPETIPAEGLDPRAAGHIDDRRRPIAMSQRGGEHREPFDVVRTTPGEIERDPNGVVSEHGRKAARRLRGFPGKRDPVARQPTAAEAGRVDKAQAGLCNAAPVSEMRY